VADVGVSIESAALAEGLGFLPLAEERFDLVVRTEVAGSAPVDRLFDMMSSGAFRAEAATLPGYDLETTGDAVTVPG
jgi:molybdate-binding protein